MADLREITENAAGNQSGSLSNIESILRQMNARLKDIDDSMSDWDGRIPSQSNYRSFRNRNDNSDDKKTTFRNRYDDRNDYSFNRRSFKNTRRGFMDNFEGALIDGFLGADFKKQLGGVFKDLAKRMGGDISDIPGLFGKQLGNFAMSALRNSTTGRQLMAGVDKLKGNLIANLQTTGNSIIDRLQNPDTSRASQAIDRRLNPFVNAQGTGGAFVRGAGAGLGGLWDITKAGFSAVGNLPKLVKSLFAEPIKDVREEGMSTSETSQESQSYYERVSANPSSELTDMSFDNLIDSVGKDFPEMVEGLEGPLSNVGSTAMKAATEMGAGGAEAAGAMMSLGPHALAVAGAMIAIEIVTERLQQAFKDIIGGISKIFGALGNASKRDQVQREKNLEAYKTRLAADYRIMVEEPFNILKKAAEDIYSAWDQNLATVSATQGYTKADVNDLMAAYAERIREEGLSKYVSGSDLYNQLAKVLDSGLSGKVAEEFAYQATVLGKAIPTQDFFNYASTYSSVAANAIRQGMTQEQAIAKANESLQEFASNLLYANRELSGGFTTGLKNAESIYSEASKIALAAHSDNLNAISGSLLAVQSYVGAVAPDVADALTNTIYTLATGGNSSSSVALRSLAGVNASNTEFLKAFAENPQEILGTMFTNLATMFSDSADAYMEKAEGYAELFGVETAAFQRVDFAELANAIRSMNINNESLSENMALLLAGQTTTTAEQLKNQQINQYLVDEALALVLDNEVSRAIQQHMWDEQLAREITQSTFSVDLIGDSASGLQSIIKGVQNILDFLNPFSWLKSAGNILGTMEEGLQQSVDIAQMLELTKVGEGNALSFHQLTTYNENLGVVDSLVNLLGGKSLYNNGAGMKSWDNLTNPLFHINDSIASLESGLQSRISRANIAQDETVQAVSNLGISLPYVGSNATKSPNSKYSWGFVSKATGNLATSILSALAENTTSSLANFVSSAPGTDVTVSAAKQSIEKMLESSYIQDQFVKEGKSYEDWKSTASSFGIADFDKAMEAAGYTEDQLKNFFAEQETRAGVEAQHERDMKEEHFWEVGVSFWDDKFWSEYSDPMFEEMTKVEDALTAIQLNQLTWKQFYKEEWLENRWDDQWNPTVAGENGIHDLLDKWRTNWELLFSSEESLFGKLYKRIEEYTAYTSYYGVSSASNIKSSELLQRLEKVNADTKAEERESSAYQIGKVLSETLIDDTSTNPTLQTNVLLGQILIELGKVVQQTANSGGSGMISDLTAMALGMTTKTP